MDDARDAVCLQIGVEVSGMENPTLSMEQPWSLRTSKRSRKGLQNVPEGGKEKKGNGCGRWSAIYDIAVAIAVAVAISR